jgi:hypothetical protein
MVYMISRWEQAFTTEGPRKVCEGMRFLSYDRLFGSRRLPKGTYVFMDIDRLSLHELELASIIHRELAAGGAAVLNDPATVLTRFDLLKALHREGINDFNTWRPQYHEWPERYPVFLRRNAFHQGVLTDLLHSREELEAAMASVVGQGVPCSNTIAVEYAAEPTEGNVFRKFSVYRIGSRYFQDTAVNQNGWVVKCGETGAGGEEFYEAETRTIGTVPHEESVKRVFEIAGIQYGRVDFGMYRGRPQFYEINTNPQVSFSTDHPSQFRRTSRETFVSNYRSAIEALETPGGSEFIGIQSWVLRKLHKRCRLRKRWFRPFRSRPTF